MQAFKLSLVLLISVYLAACDSGLPSDGNSETFTPAGFAEPLSSAEYDNMSPMEQYQVSTKLMATMFRGIPVEDFFAISSPMSDPLLLDNSPYTLDAIKSALNTELSNEQVRTVQVSIDGLDENNNPDEDLAKYIFSGEDRPKEEPLALIKEFPLSRNFFIAWMAQFLSNTIMFSPAEEMESTNIRDVQNTYRRLSNGLTQDLGVRQIIRSHLPSVQRWRVSRTPENTGIEAFELYLGLFETAEDSVRVGTACKDFFLTDEDDGYELASNNFPNTEPQVILQEDTDGDEVGDSGGFFITSCEDFYNVISGHPLVIPRACAVIVNYLMAESSTDDRLAMCESIASSGASTFEDIFTGIIYSREYLIDTERPKGFEENFMSMLDALKWNPLANTGEVDEQIWRNMSTRDFRRIYMPAMGWATMELKIGRTPNVPTDALSFANYHKAIREELLTRDDSYEGRVRNINGEDVYVEGLFYDVDDEMNLQPREGFERLRQFPSEFIHFMFLTALQRPATQTEVTDLMTILDNTFNTQLFDHDDNSSTDPITVIRTNNLDNSAGIILDYISRLPEFYYLKTVG